jgi:glycosyltransferase involved in cell wall biosynthesis
MRIITEFRLFDGLIVVSAALKDFFLRDLSLKIKILEVPILINSIEDPMNMNDLSESSSTLVYTGSLLNNKDGILIILMAFAKILQEHPNVKLIMTGDLDGSVDKEIIIAKLNVLNIKNKVEFTGYISSTKLHEITTSASALLAAKPENRQNRYNMATKIGEYLLTGRPVVVSSVDPVCLYLSHRENAFIVNPDENQIAREIGFILNNPKEANAIGLSGKEFAMKLFDYKIQAKRINSFFTDLIS